MIIISPYYELLLQYLTIDHILKEQEGVSVFYAFIQTAPGSNFDCVITNPDRFWIFFVSLSRKIKGRCI